MLSLITDPRFVLVGDSLTQQNNATVSLNTITLTRDSAGIVTVPKTAHGILGSPMIYTVNCADPSFEALAQATRIDANNYSYPTGVTGAPGTTVGVPLTQSIIQNRISTTSYWAWLQGLFGGGARFVGNLGQGGDRADEMGAAVALACTTNAQYVVLAAGINDINSGAATGATVISRVQTHVNTILAAGKKCVLVGVTPLGSGFASNSKNTATLAANVGFQAIATANPGTVFFANAHPDLVDTGATQFTTGIAWPWATTDGVHWGERTAKLIAQRIYDAINASVIVTNIMPTSSGTLPTVPGYTAVKQYGAWTGAGGGFNGTGSSGTVAPQFQVISSNAATTTVNTLVDRGGSLGYWQQHVITPGGVNHNITDYFQNNAGETLASLGLTTSDTVILAVEFEYSNALASGLLGLQLDCNSNSTGLYGYGRCGGFVGSVTYNNDSASGLLVTGEFLLNGSVTHIQSQLQARFAAATASTCTFRTGRVILLKKNP